MRFYCINTYFRPFLSAYNKYFTAYPSIVRFRLTNENNVV